MGIKRDIQCVQGQRTRPTMPAEPHGALGWFSIPLAAPLPRQAALTATRNYYLFIFFQVLMRHAAKPINLAPFSSHGSCVLWCK